MRGGLMVDQNESQGPPATEYVQILGRCPECGHVNKIVAYWASPRKISKCSGCGEVIPTGAYKVIALSNDPRYPLF